MEFQFRHFRFHLASTGSPFIARYKAKGNEKDVNNMCMNLHLVVLWMTNIGIIHILAKRFIASCDKA